MMTAIFATMLLAMLVAWFRRGTIAVGILVICLALSVYLFLFEIYSKSTGFRMPWLQTWLQTDIGISSPAREA